MKGVKSLSIKESNGSVFDYLSGKTYLNLVLLWKRKTGKAGYVRHLCARYVANDIFITAQVFVKAKLNITVNSVHTEPSRGHTVTPDIVKEAAGNLRDSKSDPTFYFSSDCIKNGPDNLFVHLSPVIKSFLIHCNVVYFMLLASLVPLIKDKLGSINDSKNYRSIAMSSLILKLLDWIILLLFGSSLGDDQLQFAHQPGSSTTMCTWAAIETINYFMSFCDLSETLVVHLHETVCQGTMERKIFQCFLC